MFTDAILVSNIIYHAEKRLKDDQYDEIGLHIGYRWSSNNRHNGEWHYFDKEETKQSIMLYLSHLRTISKVLGMCGLAKWDSDDARKSWFKWAEQVWTEELPYIIPRMRLYNREDPKRLQEITAFCRGST